MNESFQVTELMLDFLNLKDTTRVEDVFVTIENCSSENSLNLRLLSGLTTDGPPAMVGKNKGAVKLLMDNAKALKPMIFF